MHARMTLTSAAGLLLIGSSLVGANLSQSREGDLDAIYVNDDQNEVDSLDIVDGSLTGADVSTHSGDVHFAGATLTADRAVFGEDADAMEYGTIGGGRGNSAGVGAVVAGGFMQSALGYAASISGGMFNEAGLVASVGGGFQNHAVGDYSSVSGGADNAAQGVWSSIGGGSANTADGSYSTVVGGLRNHAVGHSSLAAGTEAVAKHEGSFVWGDATLGGSKKKSSGENQFNVYASGGVRIFTDTEARAGVYLEPGGSSWKTRVDSDDVKDPVPADPKVFLDLLAQVPLYEWSESEEAGGGRHVSPVGNDLYRVVGLGSPEPVVDTLDLAGASVAAIQALRQLVADQAAELQRLRGRVEQLEAITLR